MAGRYAKEKYPRNLIGLKFGKLSVIGKGECAIHSLPGLFDSLQDIAKEISIK